MYKLVVLGMDGLNPQRVRQWLDDLPNLKKMHEEGIWGDLESTLPPTGPQAWISLQSGQNPGAYGLWGYTYRDDFSSYNETKSIDSRVIDDRVDCLHKILPKLGQKIALIGVPPTWPPPEVPGGYCISDCVPASGETGFTWPKSLEPEVNSLVGKYIFDPFDATLNDKAKDLDHVLKRIQETDSQRHTLVRYFVREKNCDYVSAVLAGARLIHRLFSDEFVQGDSVSPYEDVLRDYYKRIDMNLGEIRGTLDSDTGLCVCSPYSTQRVDGHLNLNEWLIHNGYMTLHRYPEKPTAVRDLSVDWRKTKCWSVGNSGKIYVNLKGRETQGIVDPQEHDSLLDELTGKLSEIHVENGRTLNVQAFKREDIHSGQYEEYGPDLFIQIEKMPWNTNDWVGYGLGVICSSGRREESNTEYHGRYGYFCLSGSDLPTIGELRDISVLNMAPTVMEILRLEIPAHMEKPSILSMARGKQKKSSVSRKERVRSRLKALGY